MGLTDGLGGFAAVLPNGSASAKKPVSWLASLLTLSEQVRAATEQPVTFRRALFWQDGEEVIWPRTVNLIQGQTGVHKSRVAELFGSALLAPGAVRGDALGLEFRPAEGETYRLLYIDTERNTSDQLPYAIQSLKARAGYGLKQHPPDLDYTSLVMLPRAERFPALSEYLAHHRAGFVGHLVVILDVLSDCVADYNDVAASLGLLDLLNVAVNEQNATFLAVIHENPGSTAKARGHLGTEASNKASTVLQVGFVKEGGRATELIQLLYLKRRYAAPGLAFFAIFDEATRGLLRADVAIDEARESHDTRFQRKVSDIALGAAIIDSLVDGPLQYGALIVALIEKLEVKKRAAQQYLAALFSENGGLVGDGNRAYWLHKKEQGRTVLYSLSQCSQPP